MSDHTDVSMSFERAVRLVEKATFDSFSLTLSEMLELGLAQAIVAREYIHIKDRIMPA